ncbi:hypothetical protein GGI35DRAFT_178183 [Trichoderma velutinum]
MKTADYITYVLACAGTVAGQVLGRPSLNYLGFMNLTLGPPLVAGDDGLGRQATVPITGGTVRGSRVTGKVLSVGADYGSFDATGFYHPDARLNIQTNDGAFIYVQLYGVQLANDQGQPDTRGIVRVKYEAGDTNYTWLNSVAATAIYEIPTAGHNTYLLVDVWETKPPQKKAFP